MDKGNQDFLNMTNRYFATWAGVDPSDLERRGVFAKYSEERNQKQAGYGRRFDLYCVLKDQTTVISYGSRLENEIQKIVSIFEKQINIEDRKQALHGLLGVKPIHSFKYYFTELPSDLDVSGVVKLTPQDYSEFLQFFKSQHPKVDTEGWHEEYFNSISDKGYVYGIYKDGRLVSATDAGDVPYMTDLIMEPGINTLEGYRKRGYAKKVVSAVISYLLDIDRVPIWSCSATNTASQRLAESLGYRKLLDVITVTMKE